MQTLNDELFSGHSPDGAHRLENGINVIRQENKTKNQKIVKQMTCVRLLEEEKRTPLFCFERFSFYLSTTHPTITTGCYHFYNVGRICVNAFHSTPPRSYKRTLSRTYGIGVNRQTNNEHQNSSPRI